MGVGIRILREDGVEEEQGRRVLPEDVIRLGRDPRCQLRFDGRDWPTVSNYHAKLTVHGNSLRLEDKGSTYGTFINGRRVGSPVQVGSRDEIRLGPNGPRILAEVTAAANRAAASGRRQGTLKVLLDRVRHLEKSRKLLFLALCGLIVVFLLGIGIMAIPGGAGPPPSRAPNWQQIGRRYERAVFLLLIPGRGMGTCFAISRDGVLATNGHVAEMLRGSTGAIAVQNGTGVAFDVDLSRVRLHPGFDRSPRSDDVAIFEIRGAGTDLTALPLASSSELRALSSGEELATIGFPGEFSAEYLRDRDSAGRYRRAVATLKLARIGRITDYDLRSTESTRERLIQHSASLTPGTSGSPMLNAAGHVVGVHNAVRASRGTPQLDAQLRLAIRCDALIELVRSTDWASGRVRLE